jgi:hypothetical protein
VHTARITCMKLVDKHIWSCSFNRVINILDTKTRQSVHVISGLTEPVSSLDVVCESLSPPPPRPMQTI